ncbi:MAG: glycoside hydrolase family 130 protein [Planctomycetota bacterium]|jgi:predicted GH43/DUF377 family glycosyl hydrolase
MKYESPVEVTRLPHKLLPDPARVITRFFCPGDEKRIKAIITRIMELSEMEVSFLVSRLKDRFGWKHVNFNDVVAENFEAVAPHVHDAAGISERRRLLIGAYFTMEYAIEAAALFNPSMVPAFNQDGLPSGSTRFLMALRATGEGHVSSIVFRRGVIDADMNIDIDPVSPYARQLKITENRVYEKATYRLKLIEMGGYSAPAGSVLKLLGDEFTLHDLNEAIDQERNSLETPALLQETAENMLSLARANYHMELPAGADPSEIVIFPFSENESHGIEDVRLVRFTDDDGTTRYYGTYTAFNGFRIVPQILEVTDQRTVMVHTMSGCYAQNKGMALFPRKLDELYLMISRLDNENLYLMRSDNVRFWNEAQLIQTPKFAWELVQIGNCGSPLETDEGWLVLTHGVGPLRQYCIGATLLDREDPSRLIGQTKEPLLVPTGDERTGYVPNVVYSCGGMIHNDTLIIPYAMSDVCTSFATVPLQDLLAVLSAQGGV